MDEENTDVSWRESLPEGMRDLPFIGKADSLETAANAIKDAAQWMGNSIRIPGEAASDDDKAKFTQKVLEKFPDLMPKPGADDDENYAAVLAALGTPGDGKEYGLPEIDEFEWPEDFSQSLRERAQAAGLTKKQFQQWAKDIGTQLRDEQLAAAQQHDEDLGGLKKEWGEAFEGKVKQLSRWLEDTEAPDGFVAAVKNGQVPSSTMRWLNALHKANVKDEGSNVADQGINDGEPMLTPNEAEVQIQEILRNPEYFKAGSPIQKKLMKQMIRLQKFRAAG